MTTKLRTQCATLLLLAACNTPTTSTMTDIDGNIYPTVTIGSQVWMTANLRTTRYSDGGPIKEVTGDRAWTRLQTAAWCNYKNEHQYDSLQGKRYNGYAAAMPRICPNGWHVPSETEWQQLEITLGMTADQTEQLDDARERGNNKTWFGNSQNTFAAMKQLGFFADLGRGTRAAWDGTFTRNDDIVWWSRSKSDSEEMWYREVDCPGCSVDRDGGSGIGKGSASVINGFCIRCIQDGTGTDQQETSDLYERQKFEELFLGKPKSFVIERLGEPDETDSRNAGMKETGTRTDYEGARDLAESIHGRQVTTYRYVFKDWYRYNDRVFEGTPDNLLHQTWLRFDADGRYVEKVIYKR